MRTRGADPDGEQRFAALAELCRPVLDRLDHLPAARAAALRLGTPPAGVDRYAVYAGMAGLLTRAAMDAPILAVVDDAHLLDEASAEEHQRNTVALGRVIRASRGADAPTRPSLSRRN